MKTSEDRRTVDFSASIGIERKEKMSRIAASQNRSMSGQLCQWIDEAEDPRDEKEGRKR